MQGLTQRQQMVLDFIRQSITDRGYPPTLREIGARMGIRSTNGVNDHLRALERKGYLTREDMKSRALRPDAAPGAARRSASADGPAQPDDAGRTTSTSSRSRSLGRVAAGLPLLAEEHVIDTVRIDRTLVSGGREVFGLKVHGDSMIDAGILSGDYIFVREAAHGEPRRHRRRPHRRRGDGEVLLPREGPRPLPAGEQEHGADLRARGATSSPTMLLGVVVGVFRRI